MTKGRKRVFGREFLETNLKFIAILSTLLFLITPSALAESSPKEIKRAVFAGGCFWCMEPPFEKKDGVIEAISGYTGGTKLAPTYKEVTQGNTGHYEVIEVRYDPAVITYKELLDIFWVNIDPLDSRGQFCDKGTQYLSAIFYGSPEEKVAAEESAKEIGKTLKEELATKILPLGVFYEAEEYHQDYYKKKPLRYKFYRYNCGRDKRLKALWGDKE